jgi:Fe2+ transport system protein FeoA
MGRSKDEQITSQTADRPVPLSTLETGARAMVSRCLLSGEDRELLAAMGLADRCPLRVCRAGSPCIIQIASTRLGLSAKMARRVLVHRS